MIPLLGMYPKAIIGQRTKGCIDRTVHHSTTDNPEKMETAHNRGVTR